VGLVGRIIQIEYGFAVDRVALENISIVSDSAAGLDRRVG
jgi:hypothetical protein